MADLSVVDSQPLPSTGGLSVVDSQPLPGESAFSKFVSTAASYLPTPHNILAGVKEWWNRPEEVGKAMDALHVLNKAASLPENKGKPPAQWKEPNYTDDEKAVIERGLNANLPGAEAQNPLLQPTINATAHVAESEYAKAGGDLTGGYVIPAATVVGGEGAANVAGKAVDFAKASHPIAKEIIYDPGVQREVAGAGGAVIGGGLGHASGLPYAGVGGAVVGRYIGRAVAGAIQKGAEEHAANVRTTPPPEMEGEPLSPGGIPTGPDLSGDGTVADYLERELAAKKAAATPALDPFAPTQEDLDLAARGWNEKNFAALPKDIQNGLRTAIRNDNIKKATSGYMTSGQYVEQPPKAPAAPEATAPPSQTGPEAIDAYLKSKNPNYVGGKAGDAHAPAPVGSVPPAAPEPQQPASPESATPAEPVSPPAENPQSGQEVTKPETELQPGTIATGSPAAIIGEYTAAKALEKDAKLAQRFSGKSIPEITDPSDPNYMSDADLLSHIKAIGGKAPRKGAGTSAVPDRPLSLIREHVANAMRKMRTPPQVVQDAIAKSKANQ